MAIFYIDPSLSSNGSGTENSPFNTWASVTFSAGNSYLQKANTIFYGAIVVNSSGTSGSPIILGKYGTGDNPKVINVSGTGLQSAGNNFVIIQNFDATGCSSHGMNLRGSNCLFENLNSYKNGGSGVTFNLGASWSNTVFRNVKCYSNVDHAIGAPGTTASVTISNILFENCQGLSSSGNTKHGLYMEFLPGATTSKLINIRVVGGIFAYNSAAGINIRNTVDTYPGPSSLYNEKILIKKTTSFSNGTAGISLLGSINSEISFNSCFGNGFQGTLGGIWTGRNTNLQCYKNKSVNNTTNGIDGAGIFDDQYNESCSFYSNYIANNLGSSSQPYYSGFGVAVYGANNSKHSGNVIVGNNQGIWISNPVSPTTNNCRIYNNTFIGNKISGINYDFDLGNNKAEVYNNIVLNSNHGIYKPGAGNSFTENYNCCFNNGINFSGITKNTNSIEVNPKFKYSIIPTEALLVSSGTTVSGWNFYGKPLKTTPNIGAC